MKSLLALGALITLNGVAMAEDGPNPAYEFLKAADAGDLEAMTATIDPKKGVSAKSLLTKLDGCYLRRVYATPENGILAAWMCDEGENKSRVLMAEIYHGSGGAAVKIVNEQTNNRPAPPRTGPALADEDS